MSSARNTDVRVMVLPVEPVNHKQSVAKPAWVSVEAVFFERARKIVEHNIGWVGQEGFEDRKGVVSSL